MVVVLVKKLKNDNLAPYAPGCGVGSNYYYYINYDIFICYIFKL